MDEALRLTMATSAYEKSSRKGKLKGSKIKRSKVSKNLFFGLETRLGEVMRPVMIIVTGDRGCDKNGERWWWWWLWL